MLLTFVIYLRCNLCRGGMNFGAEVISELGDCWSVVVKLAGRLKLRGIGD